MGRKPVVSGLGIVCVLLHLCLPLWAFAQDMSGLVAFFNDHLIPVKQIQRVDGTIQVIYEMMPVMDEEGLGPHILYILGQVAYQFPDAEAIQVDCRVAERTLFEYRTDTQNILEYVDGRASDEEMLSRIAVRDFSAKSGVVSGAGSILGVGLGVSLVALVLLGGIVVTWRFVGHHRPALPGRARDPATRPGRRAGQTQPSTAPVGHGWGSISVVQGSTVLRTLTLDKPILTMGRSAGGDLVLRDSLISRRHAEICRREGQALLCDLGSTNGTFLNELRITRPQRLRPGDVIRLGHTQLVFGAAGSQPPTAWALPSTRVGPVSLVLDREVLTIGRGSASDLVLVDGLVSRRHARIRWQGDTAVLYDLGSSNGTFVNRVRIRNPHPLRPGDVIRVGQTELVFRPPALPQQHASVPGQLIVQRGESFPATLDLGGKAQVHVGRSQRNDVVIPHDPHVSRQHARVQTARGGHEIVDLGSNSGVFLNGRRVRRARLGSGDRIRLGNTEFIYQGPRNLPAC